MNHEKVKMAAHEPVYLGAARSGRLKEVVEKAIKLLSKCMLCPRRCHVDRLAGEMGTCKTGQDAMISGWNAHFGEEGPLVGRNGSGTVFLTHCNLGCIFCQNYDISHLGRGRTASSEALSDIMLSLQADGCHNINFVSPSHVVPQILAAVEIAVEKGLHIPLVYNTSGYDRVDTLKLLDGIVDIYMPDFKFWDSKMADDSCQAPDYPAVARRAIKEMHRQVGDLAIDEAGVAQRGLLIRHLVLPEGLAGTDDVMAFIANQISTNTYVNIMSQYRPCGRAHEINRFGSPVSPAAYQAAAQMAKERGILRLDRP